VREKSNFLAYIFLLLTVTFWAGNFIVGKFASFYEVPPFSLNFYRWFFAWLILAPFTIPEILKKKFTLPLLTLVQILCTFGLIFVFPQFLYELSQGLKFKLVFSSAIIPEIILPEIGPKVQPRW